MTAMMPSLSVTFASFFGGYNETDMGVLNKDFKNYFDSYSPYIILSSQDIITGDIFILMLVNISTYLNSAFLKFDLGNSKPIKDDFKNMPNPFVLFPW